MKPRLTYILCGFLLILFSTAGFAQPAIEFANGSGPAGSGSSLANQVVTFQNNALNPVTGTYTPLTPNVTATFSIYNQQYLLSPTQNPNGGDLSFGATINAGGTLITSAALFPPMGAVGGATASDFSATQDNIGAGMDMSNNYATELFTSAEGLYNANAPTGAMYLIAYLNVTFSEPLTDPVIHIVGIGGTFGALGFTTQLTLTTAGLTMTELSGSTEFSVTGGRNIVNTAASPTGTTGSGAASGSVLINGGSVTSLTFEVYLRGDGKTPAWSNAHEHTGDAWLFGVSGLNTFVALPLGTTGFTAEPQQHSVDLQWSTSSQESPKYFAIERSRDGINWSYIGRQAAGNSQYNYVDQQPLTGANYYRLQEVADDGSTAYSPIRNVNFTGSAITASWYPNPTHDRLTITNNNNLRSIVLTTLDGRILQSFDGFASGQSLDLSRYPLGIYFLVMRTADGQTRTEKIEKD